MPHPLLHNDGMENKTAEEKKEDFGEKDGSVEMGGAHKILNTRDGMASRTAEENKEDCGGKERCVVVGGAHPI